MPDVRRCFVVSQAVTFGMAARLTEPRRRADFAIPILWVWTAAVVANLQMRNRSPWLSRKHGLQMTMRTAWWCSLAANP